MSLRQAAASGVKWTVATFSIGVGLRLFVVGFLSRHLSQDDFGLVGMISALVAVLQTFGDFGLGAAIVQSRSAHEEQLSSVFWLAQIFGVTAFVGAIALEPAIAAFYGEPRLGGLVVWLALRFLIIPVGIPFQGLLQRALRFRPLFWIQTASSLIGATVSIGGATAGWGIFSLIWGDLAGAASLSALSLAAGWREWHPRLRLRLADLRGMLGFGANQVGDRTLSLIAMSIDNVFVGRFLGARSLGFYSVAFEIASLPTRLNLVLTRVAFPVFAKRQSDDESLARGYLELSRLIGIAQFPLLVAIGVLADLLVPLLLGPGWIEVVPLVRILAIFGLVRVLGNPSGAMLLAKGRADIGFRLNVVISVTNAIVFWFVAPHGTVVVAWTWVALVVPQLVVLTLVLGKLIGLRAAAYLHALARPAAIALFTAIVLLGARTLMTAFTSRLLLITGGTLLLAAPLVVAGTWWMERDFLTRLARALRR